MTRLSAAELFAEMDWLFSQGMTPWEVASATGRSVNALEKFGYRNGRPDLGALFGRLRRAA